MKKKQQKIKEQQKPKNKLLTFDQRFKDKKNIVGKLGVLDLLGLHQPFDLERQPTPKLQEYIVETPMKEQKQKNPQKQIQKRKMIQSQTAPPRNKTSDPHLRTNKTESLKNIPKGLKIQKNTQQKYVLPRISKSTANLIEVDLKHNNKINLSTRQYWHGKNNRIINKKRSASQLSCFNLIKADIQANHHFENLAKFQKITKNHRKSLMILNA